MQALRPDSDTKLHIATVQGMVRRILGVDGPEQMPAVDTYDESGIHWDKGAQVPHLRKSAPDEAASWLRSGRENSPGGN